MSASVGRDLALSARECDSDCLTMSVVMAGGVLSPRDVRPRQDKANFIRRRTILRPKHPYIPRGDILLEGEQDSDSATVQG